MNYFERLRFLQDERAKLDKVASAVLLETGVNLALCEYRVEQGIPLAAHEQRAVDRAARLWEEM